MMNPSTSLNRMASCSLRPLAVAVAFGLGVSTFAAQAATLSFTGLFAQDDEQFVIPFNTPAGTVSMQTWSFGGGINAAGDAIAAGGFAPVVSLFGALTGELLGVAQAGVAGCGAGQPDPATGFCWDVELSAVLSPGDYIAVLTQDDNTPLGPVLSDGFQRDGQGNFTGGPFLLFTGDQRDGHWALDLILPAQQVPAPGTAWLALLGLGVLRLARRPQAPGA